MQCKKMTGLGTHLFDKITQPEDSEVTFSVFKSSCHLLLKGEAILKCLAQGHNKRTCQPIFTLTLLNAER